MGGGDVLTLNGTLSATENFKRVSALIEKTLTPDVARDNS